MWTVEAKFARLWWKLGFLILRKFVIADRHIKNYITAISKHHAKWGKAFGQQRRQICEY